MNESEIRLKIILVLSKVLSLSENDIKAKIESGNLIFWDSLTHLNLIFSLEDEFGLSFTEKDLILMEDFNKILCKVAEKLE